MAIKAQRGRLFPAAWESKPEKEGAMAAPRSSRLTSRHLGSINLPKIYLFEFLVDVNYI